MTDDQERLTRLEDWRNGADLIFGELKSDLKAIHDCVIALRVDLAAKRDCPAPGLCLEIEKYVKRNTGIIDEQLVPALERSKGIASILKIFVALLSGGFLVEILHLIVRKP
jgi:hypothetical protein